MLPPLYFFFNSNDYLVCRSNRGFQSKKSVHFMKNAARNKLQVTLPDSAYISRFSTFFLNIFLNFSA